MSPQQPPASRPSPDDDLSLLLRRAYDCQPPREEFVAGLAKRLEAEYDSSLVSSPDGCAAEFTEQGAAVLTVQTGRSSWRRTRRSMAAIGAVAVLVMAAVIGTSRPGYSWTSMLLALEAQSWVKSTVDDPLQQTTHGWFSQRNQLVVIQRGNDLRWNDWQDGLQSRYQSGSGVLLRERLNPGQPYSAQASLLSFLQAGINGAGESDAPHLSVLSESWRTIGAGNNQQVELNVVLGRGEHDPSPMHLLLTLDPQTHLPLRCQLIGEGAVVASTVHFAYPGQGPQDVYDVGVPRDVVVQDVHSSGEGVRVASVDHKPGPEPPVPVPVVDQPLSSVGAPIDLPPLWPNRRSHWRTWIRHCPLR